MSDIKKVDFKSYAQDFDKHRKADFKLIEIAADILNLDVNSNILDFGCGTGNYLKCLQERGFLHLFGLDKSEEMCIISSEKTSAIIKNGSHLDFPFEKASFRAVIIIDVVHFINDLQGLFKSLQHACEINGRVFIATQSHEQLEKRIYSKYFPSTTEIDKRRHHDIKSLITIAETCGFSLVSEKKYLSNTDFLVDWDYFDLINKKSFYVLRLITPEEFNSGMQQFQFDLRDGNIIAKFPGRTLITLEKKEEITNGRS